MVTRRFKAVRTTPDSAGAVVGDLTTTTEG
jgi:hypothetical protein